MEINQLSDSKLLELYFAGDRDTISTLISRHKRRVVDYINMMVRDRDEADDIFQETIIKVVRSLDDGKYVDNGKFLSWVLRVAHNQVIDHFRRTKQEQKLTEADAGFDILGSLRFSNDTVEDKMVQEQIHKDLRRMIDHLPEDQRNVVMLRYFEGMNFKDIAEELGIGINTALGRMRYALINLRKLIHENHIVLTV